MLKPIAGSQFTMMTSSNGNIFRVTGPLCGEFTGPGEFPTQRPVTRSFDVYFGLNKRLCKQSWGWWLETLLCPLWRHSNAKRLGDSSSYPVKSRCCEMGYYHRVGVTFTWHPAAERSMKFQSDRTILAPYLARPWSGSKTSNGLVNRGLDVSTNYWIECDYGMGYDFD